MKMSAMKWRMAYSMACENSKQWRKYGVMKAAAKRENENQRINVSEYGVINQWAGAQRKHGVSMAYVAAYRKAWRNGWRNGENGNGSNNGGNQRKRKP